MLAEEDLTVANREEKAAAGFDAIPRVAAPSRFVGEGLGEIGAVELHPWNATADDIEHADRILIDLDPGEGVAWDVVVETALAMRELMESEGLESWPKLTGSKGIHVMAPLSSRMTHDAARTYARGLAQRFAKLSPDKYLLSSDPDARPGRIFLDYLCNGRGNTAVGAWSPRVRPGFPIAVPVTWKQIEQGVRSDAFSIKSPFRARRTKAATGGISTSRYQAGRVIRLDPEHLSVSIRCAS